MGTCGKIKVGIRRKPRTKIGVRVKAKPKAGIKKRPSIPYTRARYTA